MATCNFPCVNTSKYYVFGLDEDPENATLNYKWTLEACAEVLFSKGWISDNPAYKTVMLDYCGVQIYITISAKVIPGYYEGAVFDYDLVVEAYDPDGYPFEYNCGEYGPCDEDDVIRDNWCGNLGLSKIHAAKITKKLKEACESLRKEAEDTFNDVCEEKWVRVGCFSDGSAIYKTIA